MTVLFIADLHLRETCPAVAERFLQFTQTTARQAEALYILGDFFEVWIGDDDLTPFHVKIIKALKDLTAAGVKIYFMRGNRDFLIGKKFVRLTGCKLIKDPTVIAIEGKRILLTHGDKLNSADKKYLAFRRRYQNWLVKKIFLWFLPLKLRKLIAQKIRKESQAYVAANRNSNYGVIKADALKLMLKYHADYLIHGHFHKADIYTPTPSHPCFSLGDWESNNTMQILSCDINGFYPL